MIKPLIFMLLSSSAMAQTTRSVEYFIYHTPERIAMNRVCGGTTSPECRNAQQANHFMALAAAKQQVNNNRLGVGSIDSPQYFDANPLARITVLQECTYPSSAIRPDANECRAARMSASR